MPTNTKRCWHLCWLAVHRIFFQACLRQPLITTSNKMWSSRTWQVARQRMPHAVRSFLSVVAPAPAHSLSQLPPISYDAFHSHRSNKSIHDIHINYLSSSLTYRGHCVSRRFPPARIAFRRTYPRAHRFGNDWSVLPWARAFRRSYHNITCL